MTERGFAGAGPDVACPFVAFDDDRNLRASHPDHRHRCYADLRPALRALAHQEAFCLGPNFGRCPTFLDWARREAAQVVPPDAGGPEQVDRPSLPAALGGTGGEGEPVVPVDAGEVGSVSARPTAATHRRRGRIPGWERPRRWDSYPALPRPRGRSTAPTVVLAALLVALGAIVLFVVPPMLLERGTAGPLTSPSAPVFPGPSASSVPSPSPSPGATPFIYVVQRGDTLTRIAHRFGVTIEQIVAANAGTVKDPNVLQIGDRLVIPTPVPSVISDAGATGAPSP